MVKAIESAPFSQLLKSEDEKLSNKKFQKTSQTATLENLESGKQPEYNPSSVNSLFDGAQGNKIQFENVDKETIIKIIDSETGDLVRQIPPEELMKMRERMQELQGQFVDVTV